MHAYHNVCLIDEREREIERKREGGREGGRKEGRVGESERERASERASERARETERERCTQEGDLTDARNLAKCLSCNRAIRSDRATKYSSMLRWRNAWISSSLTAFAPFTWHCVCVCAAHGPWHEVVLLRVTLFCALLLLPHAAG